jgi:hypothetical protein
VLAAPSPSFFVSIANKRLMPSFVGQNEEVASDEWLVARTGLTACSGS